MRKLDLYFNALEQFSTNNHQFTPWGESYIVTVEGFTLIFLIFTIFVGALLSIDSYVLGFLKKSLILFIKQQMAPLNLKEYLGFPWILTLFLTILFSNALGMLPFSYTLTSLISITFSLSLLFFITLKIYFIILHEIKGLELFLPSGTPLNIAPFLFIIEIISHFAKIFSLAIRLFANLMSGHTLMHILGGVTWVLLSSGTGLFALSVLPALVIAAITSLEALIAFMQSYVFIVLFVIYFKDIIYLH